ncbi:ATP phosphoribosyltransferase regulatory subunit [Synechocystis sp. LKSZ1]|uniref:ATP phosphoribosyltransferase regulatory subunit n=1 Tax=Synechocystis sp. LKSZ1 TaxID=3144951 RepID=UPI00336BE4F9
MIHQPPAGARDLLPLEVAQKAWINDRLQAVFQRWGYQRIVTSTLEWLDTLVAGGAIDPATVVQLQDGSGSRLGLRPELTASIARAAVTRMTDGTHPQRLCYRANVFRRPPMGHPDRQVEFFQAGVELLFVGGVRADAEILLLLADSLKNLGLDRWTLILGEAGLTQGLLARFPLPLRQQVRHCMAHLDYVQLQGLEYPDSTLKQWALQLFDLRGSADEVFQRLEHFDLDGVCQQRLQNLKALVQLIQASQESLPPLILDLSWLQPFDYYTGIVFQAFGQIVDQWYVLGQGGRYDQLLSQYHPQQTSLPGIGFSFNVEELHTCLLVGDDLPKSTPVTDWLVIPQGLEAEQAAFQYAQHLREQHPQQRIEVDLGGRSPEALLDYARYAQIRQLVWVTAQGQAEVKLID